MPQRNGLAKPRQPVEVCAPDAEAQIEPVGGDSNPDTRVFTDDEWRGLAARLHLSARELEIVRAVVEDLKDTVIAARQQVSLRTVRTHFERLYRRLGVTSRAGLLVVVFRAGRQSENHGELVSDFEPTDKTRPEFDRRRNG